jgi:serine/threonine protein kinase
MDPKAQPKRESIPDRAATAATVGIPLVLPFSPGDVIADKYEIIKLIGSGGMGYVVSATHVELGHQVALKFLRPELLVHRDLVARFAKEARTAVMIKSEHVARVFDVGTLPDAGPFIAMELLEGQDLGRLVSARGPLPIEAAIDYIMQACEALATAHALGIVHRDIKPDNLFLSRTVPGVDVIKVLDFGISKLGLPESPSSQRRMTVRSTSAVGSPTYMSPEQIRAADDVDARADVWALGCVLHELLSGVPAFDAPSLTQLAAKILERPPAPLCSLKPELPAELGAVVAHCLDKDPTRRYQNVGELAAALCPFAAPRSRIVAERCRHVLDPTAIFEDVDETTGPVSWNGVNTGLDATSPSAVSTIERVTVVARRVVRDKRRLVPLGATAVLVLALGTWRTLSAGSAAPAMASQTFLTAPGPGTEPSVAEAIAEAPLQNAAESENAPPSGDVVGVVAEASAPAIAEPETRAVPRVVPRRPSPAVRPKTAPASSSAMSEPDVGF